MALGFAVGVFFGFTPLFGLKTLLAAGSAWLLRGSVMGVVVGVTFHDAFLPLMPFLLRLEYDAGHWLLSRPHDLPPAWCVRHLEPRVWLHWSTFLTTGRPLLVGSLIVGVPVAIAAYWIVREVLNQDRRKTSSQASGPRDKLNRDGMQ